MLQRANTIGFQNDCAHVYVFAYMRGVTTFRVTRFMGEGTGRWM